MLKLIAFIFIQFIFMQVSLSQDHIKEFARKTWLDYIEARNRMDILEKEVKSSYTIIRNLEKNEEKDANQIHVLNNKQDALNKKLRQSQNDYLKKSKEVKRAYDSINLLNTRNSELNKWVDSFSIALKEEKLFNEQLLREKKQLEKSLYYKIKDLEIAEVENSYFSNRDFGFKRKDGEIIYSENSKNQSIKPLFKSLEYMRFNGSVYVPPGIDSLEGKILVYINDILFDEVSRRFIAETKTTSYNHYELIEKDIKLNKKVPPKSNLKIAFVTEDIYHTNKEKLKDFFESYKSALFVISSIRPVTSGLTDSDYSETTVTDVKEVFAITDSLRTNAGYLNISVCNSLNFTGEYVSLLINDSVIIQKIKLMPYDLKFSCNYKFIKGTNLIKIKALSVSSTTNMPDCFLWLFVSTIEDDKNIYKKRVVLKKDDVFGLYIQSL